MSIIDFHTHILPNIDDGSRSLEMSLQMLEAEKKQGISDVVLTPHFYGIRSSLEDFLERRERAYKQVTLQLSPDMPQLYLGAEVAFFYGIGHAEHMERLCICGTDCMLLEMPFQEWDERVKKDLYALMQRGIVPILAHVDRYPKFQNDQRVFREILDMPVIIQLNAESFKHFIKKRYVLKLLREERRYLLGSDCHNMDSRCPNLLNARGIIEKKLGFQCLHQIDIQGETLLKGIP